MNNTKSILLFELNGKKFAFRAEDVIRVMELIEITPLPDTPNNILGVINVYGEIIAVGDIKRKLNLLPEKFTFENCIVIVSFGTRKIGYVIDKLLGYFEINKKDFIPGNEILTLLNSDMGIVKINSEMILINNVEKFFTAEELDKVQNAVSNSV